LFKPYHAFLPVESSCSLLHDAFNVSRYIRCHEHISLSAVF